ncbi:MAG: hypothetical protein MAG453_01687 [Calditrichaeota bacterium]|nr:hypothetical protein [Calditrichota bacterium]
MFLLFRHVSPGLALLLLLAALSGCAGPGRERAPEADTRASDREQESERPAQELTKQQYVDVHAFAGDDWREPWRPELDAPATIDLRSERSSETSARNSQRGESRMVQGFRVQLADVLRFDLAERVRERALALFDNVYITFRSPNYKVRAGDFTRRADAERMAGRARGAGFRDAWVVPDRVYLNPPAPAADEADSVLHEPAREGAGGEQPPGE